MKSRELILQNVAANKPAKSLLPDISYLRSCSKGSLSTFENVVKSVGGAVHHIDSWLGMMSILLADFSGASLIYCPIPELKSLMKTVDVIRTGHDLQHIELAILKGNFGVAENGAIWVTDEQIVHRASPFIAQHLAIIINDVDIVPTMHEAYDLVGDQKYSYGTFIAGPSKTADIEQSLVMGAHGPRTMTIIIRKIGKNTSLKTSL